MCPWAVTPPISSCCALSHSCTSPPWQRWQVRDLPECAETASLTGDGELAKVSQLLSFTKWFSKRNMPGFICPCLPMDHGFRSSASCRKASGRELSGVSWELLHQDHEVGKAEAWVEVQQRAEGRCDWTLLGQDGNSSTILVTCFGLLASLCSLGNCV